MSPLIRTDRLSVCYPSPKGRVVALDDVTFCVDAGTTVGIIGESGSGKTTLVNAISGGLSFHGAEVSGTVSYAGTSMLDLSRSQLLEFRRAALGYIGQDPHSALDPTMRVGQQLRHLLPKSARRSPVEDDYTLHFGRVGLPDPARVAQHYPHQLSGGMAQRVVVALALVRAPKLIIADEPTASLDSTLRTRILDLITRLAAESGATLVMVSHDLEAIRHYCDVTAVMYGGELVEFADTAALFDNPRHPYTAALLAAAPGREVPGTRLTEIPGTQHMRYADARGCVFAARCAHQVPRCLDEKPAGQVLGGDNVACHRAAELSLGLTGSGS